MEAYNFTDDEEGFAVAAQLFPEEDSQGRERAIQNKQA